MSKEKTMKKTEVPETEIDTQTATDNGTYVYCGPSVRGVARQYTAYTGGTPELLEAFLQEHPAARKLTVPAANFAETRRRLETAGTAEALLYKQIKSEL